VVTISEESVYVKGDKTQSHIDQLADAAYRKRMAPLWNFVKTVSQQASRYQVSGDRQSGQCAVSELTSWANGRALTDQRTRSVQLNMGRNLSGLALSYAKVRDVASEAQRKSIDAWLHGLASRILPLFQAVGNTNTAKGNLRYWNGLAAMSVGEIVNDQALIHFGDDSLHIGLCQADNDGALPIEMHRAGRALHYQLYATAPLVVMAAHAKKRGEYPEKDCNGALARIVAFTVTGAKDPSIVQRKTGSPQDTGPYKTFSAPFAWVDVYRKVFGDISGLNGVTVQRPLSDTWLGGDTTDQKH
jgi:poly(beta-D-mannuronate) lyase